MKTLFPLYAIIVQFVLSGLGACSREGERFVIGISQCSEDLWRETVNREILREASFRSNMEVVIRSVKDDSEQQIDDIERLITDGVDLLVIAPNEASALTPVVSKAYHSGIPVILLDRKILNDDYTAYVGADNYDLAYQLGFYAATRMNYRGNVVEVRGLAGSTADEERHRGFGDAIAQFPEIEIIAEACGNFLRGNARENMHSVFNDFKGERIDLIFAMNDQMALGVSDAMRMYYPVDRPLLIGIDALLGKGGGMEAINDGTIDASFIYPTGGDRVIELAYKILNGIGYDKENILSTGGVVDKSNVRVITLQNEQIINQQNKVEALNSRLDRNVTLYAKSRRSLFVTSVLAIFAVSVMLVLIRINKSKNKLNRQLNLQNGEIKHQVETLQIQKMKLVKLSRELEAATHAKLVFFTDISHDLKTPLTLIMGPVEELLASENIADGEKESLKLIQRNSHKLMGLLTQILEFRTYENGKMQMVYSVVALDKFFESINQLFIKFIHQKQVRFSFETDGNDLTFPFDVQKMEKIYFNLLSNALKFVMPSGTISVRIELATLKKRHCCRLSVYNSDSYIHPDHVKNVFERFYHLGGRNSGSGIGLALTKSLIKMHGGSIEVQSDEKDGTTFIVYIPMPDAAVVVQKPQNDYEGVSSYLAGQIDAIIPPPEEEENIFEKITDNDKPVVLLIEDNPDMCTYIKMMLSEKYFVVTANNGAEGIKMAAQHLPIIILSDVMMPGISGFEVCRELKSRELTKDIPVIMLTAYGMDEQKIEGFESGADAYITKPFNADILKVRIEKLIENRKNIKKLIDHEWLTGDSHKTLADSHREFINNFRKYVEAHIQEKIDIDDLAGDMGMSRSKFYRKINEITDLPPTELINVIRLKKASNLLLYDRKSISEAAYESGFSSPSYFTKTFTRYYKQRPSDYLKSHSAPPPNAVS